MVGRKALTVPADQPTLNLGWLDDRPGTGQGCCLAVIRLELGHAIGPFVHGQGQPLREYFFLHELAHELAVVGRHLVLL